MTDRFAIRPPGADDRKKRNGHECGEPCRNRDPKSWTRCAAQVSRAHVCIGPQYHTKSGSQQQAVIL